jgi:superfamily I DNA/RNA helicase
VRYVPGRTFPTSPDQEFWETGAADLLTEAIDEAGIRYDAILVDEAQDFRETWWLPVELMLHESSHFYVFLDPGQDIFGTDVKGLMDLPTTVPLTKNCRSTRQISRFASRLTGRDEPPSPAHVTGGAGVRTMTFSKRMEQIPMLEDIVRDLKQNQGLSSKDLVLLSPHSYANCILADAGYRLAGYEVKPFELTPPGEGTVYYESIHRFKGMEAPVIVLFDVRDGHVASSNANIYVGCTRARDVLYVIHEEGWSP